MPRAMARADARGVSARRGRWARARAVGAPPRPPRIARDAVAPPRVSVSRRSRTRERVDSGGWWDDFSGGGFFGGDGGGEGGGGGDEGGRGDDDEDEDDFKLDAEALLEFERKVFGQEMEIMDAHALYAWQSACAVTLVGCVQHVIDTIAFNAARAGVLTAA